MRTALAAAALALAGAPLARAGLAVQCAWPPPGGTSVAPESTDVMMTPVVGDLDGDGLPEIVIITFKDVNDNNLGEDGVLRILSGADCSEIVSVVDPGCVTCFGDPACRSLEERADEGVLCPGCGVAIADLDGDGDMEIVALAEGLPRPDGSDPDDFTAGFPRRVVVFDHEGAFVSCSEASPVWLGHLAAPALADLDGDGVAEIIVRSVAFNLDGSLRWAAPTGGWGPSVVADLDEDGSPEVVVGETVYRADGSLFWDRSDEIPISFPAVADLDGDCLPEVVLTSPNRASVLVLDGRTGATLAEAELPGGLEVCPLPNPKQGGPPTLADIDGDFIPEIGVAGCRSYSLFSVDRDGMGDITGLTLLWSQPISDDSSRITGSTLFDLEGDGRIEVLYQDQERLWIFDSSTGLVLDTFEHSNSTLIEYPALADVDADGQAELIIVGNDYNRCCDIGIKVLFDPLQPWTPTRALMNQHAYHQTNVLDDGTIPAIEKPSWRAQNDYRSQLVANRPEREDCAPLDPGCDPGGPYLVECAPGAECEGGYEVLLEAATDPAFDHSELAHVWTLDCAGEQRILEARTGSLCVPVACEGCTILLEVLAPDGRGSACETRLDWAFDGPPLRIEAPPGGELDCGDSPPTSVPEVESACGPAPEPSLATLVVDGPCPGTYTIHHTWSAIDLCGELVESSSTFEVSDTTPPELDGLPGDLEVDCADVPEPPLVVAVDDCGEPALELVEERLDGDCPDDYVLERTWTATDECGNTTSATRSVSVSDRSAPLLLGVAAGETIPCGDDLPEDPDPELVDDCDPAPMLGFVEELVPGPCPHSFDVVRTWTAIDRCGNESVASRTLFVRDLEPPVLTVPPPLLLECTGEGGVFLEDPRIQAWLASAFATDDCTDPVEVRWEAPDFFPVGCPDPAPVPVSFFAEDECGNAVRMSSTVEVVDTRPPEILALDLPGCLWSPNHMYACFPDISEHVTAVDACGGAVSIRVEDCASDQPDEAPEEGDRGGREQGNGDGHHRGDCLVAPDGSGLCVRFERQGTDREGRRYAITIVVEDSCGNSLVVPWELFVPHDQREHPCPNAKRPQRVGPNDPFPWE